MFEYTFCAVSEGDCWGIQIPVSLVIRHVYSYIGYKKVVIMLWLGVGFRIAGRCKYFPNTKNDAIVRKNLLDNEVPLFVSTKRSDK